VGALRLDGETARRREETLAVEEPLEIRIAGEPIAVTMRTPGDDFDLVAGYLVSESVARSAVDISAMRYCVGAEGAHDEVGQSTYNVIDVVLAPGHPGVDTSLRRNVVTSSACGICGRTSIASVHAATSWPIQDDAVNVGSDVLTTLPDRMRTAQQVFARTGGLHAAALFRPDGTLECLREDVGRHNAVDKVVGWALREGRLPLRERILLVSGRASFELTQKCALAGIPVLASISAPSSLAVDLANEVGITLVGFLRGQTMNIYAGTQRVRQADAVIIT
jgi:FdhD protein